MKTLGIDYGRKKIGLAISDELGMIASPLPTLRVNNTDSAINKVKRLVDEKKIEQITVGVPSGYLNIDSPQTEETKLFIERLRSSTDIPINTWDESYSTQKAEKGARKRKRRNSDSEAARIILQEYLDRAIPTKSDK